jgi:hypothetical protein
MTGIHGPPIYSLQLIVFDVAIIAYFICFKLLFILIF